MTTSQPTKVISPVKLAHVVLRTSPENWNAQVNFYKTFLGGKASFDIPNAMSFITYDDEHHRIAVIAVPGTGAKNHKTSGLEHIAFTFSSVKDLLQAYSQRKALGLEPAWCVHHGVTLSIYYRDVDGNALETQVDVFDKPEDDNAFLQSPAFLENPIGVDFDPEDFIKRLEKGESEKELLKWQGMGPRDISTVPFMLASM